MPDNDYLDTTAPDAGFYALLGEVNYAWAQLDLISSVTFAVLLNLDSVELGITIGRIETQAKISKMLSIVRHRRKDDLSTFLANIKSDLKKLRPARNAITHGAYVGKSNRDEFCFRLPAEFIVADDEETAQEMVVLTVPELQQHIMDITKIATSLLAKFDTPGMRGLFNLPLRVR